MINSYLSGVGLVIIEKYASLLEIPFRGAEIISGDLLILLFNAVKKRCCLLTIK